MVMVSMCMYRGVKNSSCPMSRVPAGVKQGDTLPSCFSSHPANKCPLYGLSGAPFSVFVHISLVISLFKTAPICSADGLSSVP